MKENTVPADPLIRSARREEICRIFGESYDPARWNDWRWQMRHRFIKPEQFEQLLRLTRPSGAVSPCRRRSSRWR